jgi:hypothetical protein
MDFASERLEIKKKSDIKKPLIIPKQTKEKLKISHHYGTRMVLWVEFFVVATSESVRG